MTDQEVLEKTRHWLETAVIGLNLCPFAKAAYVKNQARLVVSHARHADDLLEELDRELDLLVATPAEETDTTLLIHPTLFDDFLDFNDFLEIAEGVVSEHGLEGVLQLASFHPQFQFDGTEPDDIGNYTNRAPFAILHLLREESVARAVAVFPEAETIFEQNIETLQKLGHKGWKALGL
ncbi:MAG: peptidase [Burkholderiales bacterium RIFCSPHIGHO2_12_FULL_61_11]|nr:MAG: peptidase [Burkholderiales bacterium RIFCSPHIGHO2_12_FULL_61_11]